jgi:membrane dipeptidase
MTSNISPKARALHDRALVVDGHCDILMAVTDNKMDLDQRVELPGLDWQPPPGLDRNPLSKFGMGPHTVWFGCMGQYDIPRWKEGGVGAELCAVYLDDVWLRDPIQRGMEMVWNFHDQVARFPNDVVHATTVREIRDARRAGKIALVLSFEGCEPLGNDPRFLDLYYRLGLRAVSLTHTRRNIYADGCWAADKQGGLTALGREVIRRLDELRVVVDLVHIGEVGFWEILELTTRPVILSHTTPTMFADSSLGPNDLINGKLPRPRLEVPRDRPMLEAIARNGGVIGIIAVAQRNLDAVIRDIETALDVMGSDHVGLGSDFYGLELAPEGYEDIGKLPRITDALVARGHSDETIIKVLGENYLRVFETVWGG